MGILFKRYKARFRFALKPFFVMINDKRGEMPDDQWKEFIEQTRTSILSNPVDFLGDDLPEKSLLRDVLDDIFAEFHKEHAFLQRSMRRMRS